MPGIRSNAWAQSEGGRDREGVREGVRERVGDEGAG